MEALLIIEMYMLEVLHTANPCRENLIRMADPRRTPKVYKNLAQGEGLAEPWVLVVKKRVALIRRYIGAPPVKNTRSAGLELLKERKNPPTPHNGRCGATSPERH